MEAAGDRSAPRRRAGPPPISAAVSPSPVRPALRPGWTRPLESFRAGTFGISERDSMSFRTAVTVLSLTLASFAVARSDRSGFALSSSAITSRFCARVKCRRRMLTLITKARGSVPVKGVNRGSILAVRQARYRLRPSRTLPSCRTIGLISPCARMSSTSSSNSAPVISGKIAATG